MLGLRFLVAVLLGMTFDGETLTLMLRFLVAVLLGMTQALVILCDSEESSVRGNPNI